MLGINRKNLLEAGAHFGHKKDKMNSRMKKYIYGLRAGVHILDLEKTTKMLLKAYEEMKDLATSGATILFVGTKKQSIDAVKSEAERCGAFYINNRWLGGTLTNFKTIKKSIDRLKEIESESVDGLTKKEIAVRTRKKEKLHRNLDGVRDMVSLPSAIFVVDVVKDAIAVQEAVNLGIPIFAIVDSDGNPDIINYPIPANDDAVRSVALILKVIADAIIAGREGETKKLDDVEKESEDEGNQES